MIFIGSASSCDSLGGTWWAARDGAWIEVFKSKQYIELFYFIGVISIIFNLFYLDFKQFI